MQTRPQVPGYHLGELIARGSSAQVWAATTHHGRDDLAVKVVPLPPGDDGGAVATELSALAITRTPDDHLVTVHAVVAVSDPTPGVAIVMQRLRHGTLNRLVSTRGHLTAGEVVTVLTPVALTMARLHDAAVVHGDLSPSNIGFDSRGRPVVLDLGVSSVVGTPREEVYGTPGFVAPEVVAGGQPSAGADIYAIGALGWFALTGEPPPIPAERPPMDEVASGVPVAMQEALAQALHPDPDRRGDARALATAIYGSTRATPIEPGEGGDPATALTHRVREMARTPQPGATHDADSRRGRRLARRRAWPRPPRGRVLGAAVAAAVVAVAGVATVVGIGDGEARPVAPGESTVSLASSEVDRPAMVSSASQLPAPDAEAGRENDYVRLLTDVVAARSRAWNSGDVLALAASFEPGTPAHQDDLDRLAEAATAGHRYVGLEFTVSDVRLRTESTELVEVEATITTMPYAVHTLGEHRTAVDDREASTARVHLVLVRGASGWRISAVGPVPG